MSINNLNRIRGILSARLGAEIPKFNGGAKFMKLKGNTYIYSSNGINWFQDLSLTLPHVGGIDGFFDVESPEIKSSFEIPGDPKLTPTTSIENAAKIAKKVTAIKESSLSETLANNELLPKILPIDTKPQSLNLEIPLNNKAVELPATLEGLPLSVMEETSNNIKLYKEKKLLEKTQETLDNLGTTSLVGGLVLKGVGGIFGAKLATTDSELTKTADLIYDVSASAIKLAGPLGQVIGTAMEFAGAAGDIIQSLGGGTDLMTSTDKWMDSSFFNWNIGMLNGFAGKKSDSFAVDESVLHLVGSSYGGTAALLSNAQSKSGKKYGLFSSSDRKKANRLIADANMKLNIMANIAEDATDRRSIVQSMGELAGLAYSLMTNGGYNLKYTYAAKHGGLLELNPVITLEWEPQVELNWELPEFKEGGNIDINKELEWIPELQKGGELGNNDVPEIEETNLKNVIPEGALHKNKHHMEHAEGLTKKGIPVIDEDGELLAEIEHSEIIFTLEVTKKLEEYYDIFYSEESSNKEKEQAAFDAGKLLVYQILENTEDRTGLIESCKKGGSITLKKSTDDLIEEALDWVPTLMIVEEVIEEVKLEEKPKKKSEKELMKEAIKEVLIELLIK